MLKENQVSEALQVVSRQAPVFGELLKTLLERETRTLTGVTDVHAVYRAQGRVMLLRELLVAVETSRNK